MNTLQAKQIQITDYLAKIGINPIRKYTNFYYYHSPHRTDKEPSFKVNTTKNTWFDIGENKGGNIIDLVSLLNNCSLEDSLKILSGATVQSFSFQPSNKLMAANIAIKYIQPLQNVALIQYLNLRKIPFKIAYKYISEVYYTTYTEQTKPYFALAFKNNSGGFELRNGFKSVNFPNGFKGSTSPKDITMIEIPNSKAINVFEGFIDFLSALVYFKTDSPNNTTIILNSLSNINKSIDYISKFQNINLFLDNDKSGLATVKIISDKFKNVKNRANDFYPNFKDFNEFLCKSII